MGGGGGTWKFGNTLRVQVFYLENFYPSFYIAREESYRVKNSYCK